MPQFSSRARVRNIIVYGQIRITETTTSAADITEIIQFNNKIDNLKNDDLKNDGLKNDNLKNDDWKMTT
jgi:hypothetical protein